MLRFTLRTALASTAFFALILGCLLLQTRNSALRREVEMLRAEMGHLAPADDSRVNIIEVPTSDPFSWSWRVFAPPGTQFDAGIVTEDIPKRGVPSASFSGVEILDHPKEEAITMGSNGGRELTCFAMVNRSRGQTELNH